ncbi:non-canonical purine NTP pyrophosphatase [bacterium]|nr:non-canonical purine NTP pyrophosphatase [bacterium]
MKINSLLLITGNSGKAAEFKKLINIDELEISYKSLTLQELQSMRIEDIGEFKTRSAFACLKGIEKIDAVLTDDTGLFCNAMNGLPGPFIKWFMDCIGTAGLLDFVRNKNTTTQAVCLLSLGLMETKEIVQFKGVVDGRLVLAKGSNGFGWDSIFLPDGHKLTYGQMSIDEKNGMSHRTLAVRKLHDWILN